MIEPLCPYMALALARKRERVLRAALSIIEAAISGKEVDPHKLQWAADLSRRK